LPCAVATARSNEKQFGHDLRSLVADRQAVRPPTPVLAEASAVTLRVGASAERVLIEVQDHCGGLPAAAANDLFGPFERRSADRTGLGLGLAFSRWGVEANRGRIYAQPA